MLTPSNKIVQERFGTFEQSRDVEIASALQGARELSSRNYREYLKVDIFEMLAKLYRQR